MGNLDFVCIYSFTLDAIKKQGYEDSKIDFYKKNMVSKRKVGRLRSYISKEDFEQSIKEFDRENLYDEIGSHYREAESIAEQCV